ncbi:Kazal-type serine protease inhibitor domain-containing protein [Haloimpatiens massiliensis]
MDYEQDKYNCPVCGSNKVTYSEETNFCTKRYNNDKNHRSTV